VPALDPADVERAQRLFRVQRRRAMVAVAWLFALVLLLPLVFAVWPELDSLRLWGIPVSWLAVVVIPFPAMVFLAVWQLRRAEKPEDEA
jgi:FtsH-binding integral membrane protein